MKIKMRKAGIIYNIRFIFSIKNINKVTSDNFSYKCLVFTSKDKFISTQLGRSDVNIIVIIIVVVSFSLWKE